MRFPSSYKRLMRLDDLIRRRATGSPSQLAQKLELSLSSTYGYLRYMKELGCPIVYSRREQTYYYREEGRLFMGFITKPVPSARTADLVGNR